MDNPESLFEFPCRFPIKVMGRRDTDFGTHVLELMSSHVGDIKAEDISIRPSRKRKFISVTITFEAQSRQQLDDIYRSLTASEHILYVL
jgi:putative lipoic acid-binding regulatory protein